jgi:hypothetical protein
MGADMLIQSIGLKALNRFVIDDEWALSAFVLAKQAIDAIDEKRLVEINDPLRAYDDVASCKRELLSDLAQVETAILGDHRQAAKIEGGDGIILLLSGGMSWGDPPTELFESMTRLLEADVMPDARGPQEP